MRVRQLRRRPLLNKESLEPAGFKNRYNLGEYYGKNEIDTFYICGFIYNKLFSRCGGRPNR
jgi:hypothetical protein